MLTRWVGLLRDAEERSGYSPAWNEYRWCFYAHRAMQVLFLVAVASLLWHGWELLVQTEVVLPLTA